MTESTKSFTLVSDCPTPTVSIITKSNIDLIAVIVGKVSSESPPKKSFAAIDLTKTSLSLGSSNNRVLSPSNAPPDLLEDGSIAMIPTDFFFLISLINLSTRDDFPAPGGPVIPITCDLAFE